MVGWIGNIIGSLSSMGIPQIVGVGLILVMVIIIWLSSRYLKGVEKERERLANERSTYLKLSETLFKRKEDYEKLLADMKKSSKK